LTVGSEIDKCGKMKFPDNIQESVRIFLIHNYHAIQNYQREMNSKVSSGGSNQFLGNINKFY